MEALRGVAGLCMAAALCTHALEGSRALPALRLMLGLELIGRCMPLVRGLRALTEGYGG